MNLTDYIYQAKKDYEFRLKFAVEIDNDIVDKLEELLLKYGVTSVSSITKTIMQAHPMDFANIPPSEIYIVDVTLQYPVIDVELHSYLAEKLDVPKSHLVVRNLNHPDDQFESDPETNVEPSSLLGSDYEDENIDRPYGPDDFMAHYQKVRKTRDDFATWSRNEIEHDPHEFSNMKSNTKSPIHGNHVKQ